MAARAPRRHPWRHATGKLFGHNQTVRRLPSPFTRLGQSVYGEPVYTEAGAGEDRNGASRPMSFRRLAVPATALAVVVLVLAAFTGTTRRAIWWRQPRHGR